MRFPSTMFCAGLVLCLATGSVNAQSSAESRALPVLGDVKFVHDPSIMKEGDTWYVFSTANGPNRGGELPIHCSKDLQHWQSCGFVLPTIPDWIQKESPGTKELWAPDISFYNGEYRLYYAYSLFGKNTSGIALLTNKTLNPGSPEYHWKDQGLVLRSRAEDDFNAIDPNLIFDDAGQAWLAFGSFWTGIKMRRIDPKTGLLSSADTSTHSLAQRKTSNLAATARPGLPGDWQAIEAPFIVRHEGYYYLFVSFDLCCRGAKSNYKTMVGRAKNVTGPYTDADGKPMLEGGAAPLLTGNGRWAGPGGESILQQKDGDIIVFHAYDAKTGEASLQISTLSWADGWPHAALEDAPKAR